MGKSVGTDVEDGKLTLPVLYTYRASDEPTRAAIRDVYTRPDVPQRRARLFETVDLAPGLARAEARAHELVREALGWLAALGESPARKALEAAFHFVVTRRQ